MKPEERRFWGFAIFAGMQLAFAWLALALPYDEGW